GEANVDIHWSRVDHAIELLSASYERNSDSLLASELLYWWGIAVYLKTHSDPEMYKVWDVLRERFPDSIWTQRVP
ncbi:MAG TPA: thioredoxin family protein, partial [Nitrolancea sp.]